MPIPLDTDFSAFGEDIARFPLISKDLLRYSFGYKDGLNKSAILASQMQTWLATEGEASRKRVN